MLLKKSLIALGGTAHILRKYSGKIEYHCHVPLLAEKHAISLFHSEIRYSLCVTYRYPSL